MAGRYDNPISTRFLAPIDCLKIPAQYKKPIPFSTPPPQHGILSSFRSAGKNPGSKQNL